MSVMRDTRVDKKERKRGKKKKKKKKKKKNVRPAAARDGRFLNANREKGLLWQAAARKLNNQTFPERLPWLLWKATVAGGM